MGPEEHRANFYKKVSQRTGLTTEQIREFLSKRYDGYDKNKEREYMENLILFGQLQDRVKKTAPITYLPECPICGEPTSYDRSWSWTCTKGGLRHRIVGIVSKMSGLPAEQLLHRLEEFDAKDEIRQDCTRAAEEQSEIRFRAERQRQEIYQEAHSQ